MIISICENTKTSQFDVIKWYSGVKEILEIKTIFNSLSIIIDNRGALTIPIHVDGFIYNGNKFFLYELLHKINSLNIKKSLIKELESFFNAVLFIANKNTFYGNYTHKHSDNKIIDLIIAKKCGLKVPETLVSGDKKELALFFDKCSCNVITKS